MRQATWRASNLGLLIVVMTVVGTSGSFSAPVHFRLTDSTYYPALPAGIAHVSDADAVLSLADHLRPHVIAATDVGRLAVNPNASYSHEPAPMGLADFGVDPAGIAYSYNTTEFVGTAEIQALAADDGSHTSTSGYITFQLNVEVVLQNPTSRTNYTYWIQDVASVETHSEFFGMLNNIWNLSAPSAALDNQSVTGNGTVNNYPPYSWYAYAPACSVNLPGNCATLRFPQSLSLRVVSLIRNGFPEVGFDYQNGNGSWVRYDVARFPFALSFVDTGFRVNGYAYTPAGIYYDAEFDYTGPGGTQFDRGSRMNLTLSEWNGHNLEGIPSAWNHGGNTAETIGNVNDTAISVAPGIPSVHVANGSGRLGVVFGGSTVATLIVQTPLPSGDLLLDGVMVTFVSGSAFFILAPEVYSVTLLGAASGTSANANATLGAGATVTIRLGFATPESVLFRESGLPGQTNWSASLNGTIAFSTTDTISFTIPNGTYSVVIGPVSGYVADRVSFELAVSGPTITPVAWSPFLYPVTFIAEHLPAATAWWVEVDGAVTTGTSSQITVALPNGTFAFTVGAPREFAAAPSSGTVSVELSGATETIQFSIRPANVAGVVDPATATVTLDGTGIPVEGGSFNASVMPGVHEVIATDAGYRPYFANVTATAGNITFSVIELTPAPPSTRAAGSNEPGFTSLDWAVLGIASGAVAVLAALAWSGRRPRA